MSDSTAPSSGRSTIRDQEERLLGGPATLDVEEMAAAVGIPTQVLRIYWRSLGFADVPDGVKHFTQVDVDGLKAIVDLVLTDAVALETAQDLVRAQGHSMDRLVLWQVESLVADARHRHHLDDTSARLVVLDRLAEIGPVLRDQLGYVWRRQLAALLARMDKDVALSKDTSATDRLPLERAIGFIDIISYTSRAARLAPSELSSLVQAFESGARDVIAAHGARVVKTIGDAVLFVADDLETGAMVATGLLEVMDARGLPIRGSVVWGRVLSRSGDVFGPIVNLASRLSDLAGPATVLMDDVSAALLEATDSDSPFTFDHLKPVDVHGLGEVRPVRLARRATSTPAH
ncbi:adenylate/guanylate cyclase domain-containing protein [Occultella glacieicola]|uniref:Adenylate/guanylate cyclase domain-containing protein n=1 Tax=Occultella glacieicola TaxID=2518684 RepID=A0ABY2DW95_9MICO|nr:adenylate/guanylate cyclase domain-containing protein [Occultella glacieicola]TDE88004.1 adenylate/guanylate cyclase domain-containing protein [Occultella glacieicola]